MQKNKTIENANTPEEQNEAAPLRLSGDAATAFVNSIKMPGQPNAYLIETMRRNQAKG